MRGTEQKVWYEIEYALKDDEDDDWYPNWQCDSLERAVEYISGAVACNDLWKYRLLKVTHSREEIQAPYQAPH